MIKILELFQLVIYNIWADFFNILFIKSPFTIFFDHEKFEPPFTNAFNSIYNTTEGTSNWLYNGKGFENGQSASDPIISIFSVILAEVDIVYYIVRLMLLMCILMLVFGFATYFMMSCYITLYRRWVLIINFIKSDNLKNVIS
ncbi:uncharacterized protein RJT21DRAFT_114828 [Scheffersomyces amazonensis]|uniref:uncharacterized protein n=1 Tax=Scheffersomyces amazonensis TaxID=1078765 RepID=UPI00315C5EFF